jgi:hypothetical protein
MWRKSVLTKRSLHCIFMLWVKVSPESFLVFSNLSKSKLINFDSKSVMFEFFLKKILFAAVFLSWCLLAWILSTIPEFFWLG